MIKSFDPGAFTIVAPRTFEDLKVGEVFRAPSRTLTDAHATAFQAVSCDNHPIHYDVAFAKAHGHRAPLVHGLQVLAFTAPGATLLPHVFGEIFLAFVEQSSSFLEPVYPGDTLYPALTIRELTPQGDTGLVTTAVSVHNQDGALVLEGRHTYRLRAQPSPREALSHSDQDALLDEALEETFPASDPISPS